MLHTFGTKITVAPRAWSRAHSGTQALRVGSRVTVTEDPSGFFAHGRSRSVVVVRNFHDDQIRRPVHIPQACDHPDIREAGVRLHDRPPSSRTGMHVRRGARLGDDHRYGVELALAPIPNQSSQKNRPDAPYEGLPPNRWMPGTNTKCPISPFMKDGLTRLGWRFRSPGIHARRFRCRSAVVALSPMCGGRRMRYAPVGDAIYSTLIPLSEGCVFKPTFSSTRNRTRGQMCRNHAAKARRQCR